MEPPDFTAFKLYLIATGHDTSDEKALLLSESIGGVFTGVITDPDLIKQIAEKVDFDNPERRVIPIHKPGTIQ